MSELDANEKVPAKRTFSPEVEFIFLMLFGVLGGVVVALVMLWNPVQDTPIALEGHEAPLVPDSVQVGEPAPEFSAETLDGEVVSLSEMRGKVVALNFWATWCGPCEIEMPILQAAHEEFSDDGLLIVAVNAGEAPDLVEAYVDERGLTFMTVLDDDSSIAELYGVRPLPTTIWIDANGIVTAEHLGALTDDHLLEYWEDARRSGE